MGIMKDMAVTVFKFLPLKNYILLESAPNVSDNTKAVFDEMIRRGMNKKYKFVWWLNEGYANTKNIDNVKYCLYEGWLNKLIFLYYKYSSKCVISCNRFLTTDREGQKSFYLSHGTPLKSVRGYYTVPEGIDYFITAAPGVTELASYEMKAPKEIVYPLGFPRNDELLNSKCDLNTLFSSKYSKYVVWYPTFRQHKSSSVLYQGDSLPLLTDLDKAQKFNEEAKKCDTLIIIKPHFAQDVSYIKDLNLSNIQFINDEFYARKNISSYQFVGSCDALITDYSSIYFDYTLCDKPIALILEDVETYKKDTPLIEEFDYFTKGAEKIYGIDELIEFIKRVNTGVDLLANERNEIKEIANMSLSPDNSARVADFIIEKASL